MKKILFILAAVTICTGMTLTSCGSKSNSEDNKETKECPHDKKGCGSHEDCGNYDFCPEGVKNGHHNCDGHNHHGCDGHNHEGNHECTGLNHECENHSANATTGVIEVTNNDFTPKSGVVSVLDFTATWCGPCQQLKPLYKEAAKLYAGKAEFYSIDVDANEELANQYGIEAMPTIIIIDANGKKTTNVGLVDLNALKSMIDAAL